MRSLIRYVTRKSRGGIAVRDEMADGDVIVAGRGNDCGIHLPDPRVLLHHAEFSVRGGELYVSAGSSVDLRINDTYTQMSKVAPGDKIRLGPYEIEVQKAEGDVDATLAVELVQPLGDDLEQLTKRSRTHISKVGLSMRAWTWLLAASALAVLFAFPLVVNLLSQPEIAVQPMAGGSRDSMVTSATEIWSSGGISAAHKFFGTNCETCHVEPFVPVQDETCVGCHVNIQHHADPQQFAFASFADTACQGCHKEHQGAVSIARGDEAFCADCHANLTERAGHTDLRNVSEFGDDHPQFRPSVVTDAALHTVDRSREIGGDPPPQEFAGLKFPHENHLRPSGVRDPRLGANVTLECADCHVSDDGGVSMLPIDFETHCHRCHVLSFDAFIPDRELLHGMPAELFKQVSDVYDAVAMRGGYDEPESPPLVRRRPGTVLTPEQRKEVGDWAAAKAASVLQGRFGRGLCEGCHRTFDAATGEQLWSVEPVAVTTLWMPKAYFAHQPHRDVNCVACHDARPSKASSDVLMPSIAVCQSCHGGEAADDRVPSTCITCHRFHREDLPPMHQAAAR